MIIKQGAINVTKLPNENQFRTKLPKLNQTELSVNTGIKFPIDVNIKVITAIKLS